MAKSRHHIEEEVNKTLESLDQIERVEGNPFLYTRIQERMRTQSQASTSSNYLAILRLSLAAILLAVNVGGVYSYYKKVQEVKQTVVLDSMASEYGLTYEEYDVSF